LAIGGLAVILLAAGGIASVIIGDGVAYVEPANQITQAAQQMSAIEQAGTPSAHNGTGIRFAPPGQNPDHR
jgi:hypothetical protein